MAEHMKNTDDYSLVRVPNDARLPMWEILLVRIGAFTCISQFMLGASLGFGMTFWQAFWATMLGSVILQVVSLLIGIAGAREGLSTSMLTRWTGFGKYGSGIVSAVFAISMVGWFGVQNSVFAKGVDSALGGALGFPLAAGLTGLFVTAIVVFGFKWLSWTAKIAVPGFLIVMAYGIYKVLENHSLSSLISSPTPGPALTLGAATTMVAGGFIVGCVTTPDMTRYARSGKDVFWITLIGTFLGELGVNLIAVLMAHAVKDSDIMSIVLQLTGVLGAAIVAFATVKINDLNLYSSSLGVTNVINTFFNKKINRGVVTLIIGVIGTFLSIIGILDKFVAFLVFLGIWVPPIAGIMVVDYFILKRSRQVLDESRNKGTLPETYENINPVSLIAWALGFLSGYLIKGGIPSLTSILVSAIVYYIGMKIIDTISNQKKLENNKTRRMIGG
ncbi:purine-cytosine permease family protein [Fictibacillus sp. S7]|uniref:purine-cytosine permease family protein n=1 Tax=Fictibacillus sp. S7 TaxID=2212476 RepID=UPI001010F82F|nr:cytosine permease [Fictibacillus sp. S7]RXY99163.1 cytosine permease [Fictibacillus sp. S7]